MIAVGDEVLCDPTTQYHSHTKRKFVGKVTQVRPDGITVMVDRYQSGLVHPQHGMTRVLHPDKVSTLVKVRTR